MNKFTVIHRPNGDPANGIQGELYEVWRRSGSLAGRVRRVLLGDADLCTWVAYDRHGAVLGQDHNREHAIAFVTEQRVAA